jgi:hypothetical protein
VPAVGCWERVYAWSYACGCGAWRTTGDGPCRITGEGASGGEAIWRGLSGAESRLPLRAWPCLLPPRLLAVIVLRRTGAGPSACVPTVSQCLRWYGSAPPGSGASVVADEPLRRRGLPSSSDDDASGPSDAARQMQRAPPVANAQSACVCVPPPPSTDAVLHAADESVSVREAELDTVGVRRGAGGAGTGDLGVGVGVLPEREDGRAGGATGSACWCTTPASSLVRMYSVDRTGGQAYRGAIARQSPWGAGEWEGEQERAGEAPYERKPGSGPGTARGGTRPTMTLCGEALYALAGAAVRAASASQRAETDKGSPIQLARQPQPVVTPHLPFASADKSSALGPRAASAGPTWREPPDDPLCCILPAASSCRFRRTPAASDHQM